jgi:hypothetical protein
MTEAGIVAVCERQDGWRVELNGAVVFPPGAQDEAMIAGLDLASRAFEQGYRLQVTVVPAASPIALYA